jgi:hypothetical protein
MIHQIEERRDVSMLEARTTAHQIVDCLDDAWEVASDNVIAFLYSILLITKLSIRIISPV